MSELENSLLEEFEESTLEQDIKSLEFYKIVNKYESKWAPGCLFNGFTIRAIFSDPESKCMIEKYNTIEKIRSKLLKDSEEGEYWQIVENPITSQDELYMIDNSTLTLWLMKDSERIKKIFSLIEEAE